VKGHLGRELPRAGTDSREAGVGGQEAGPGSYSGGDIDPTTTGVGFGGVAASGPDDPNRLGKAETTGGSEEFASGPPARGENQGRRRGRAGGSKQIRGGTTHDRSGDDSATGDASAERDAGRSGSTSAVGFTSADQSAGVRDAGRNQARDDADIEAAAGSNADRDDDLDLDQSDDDEDDGADEV
jgi:hypothetical protein